MLVLVSVGLRVERGWHYDLGDSIVILTVYVVAVAIVLDGEDVDSTVGYMEQSASQEDYAAVVVVEVVVYYFGKMDESATVHNQDATSDIGHIVDGYLQLTQDIAPCSRWV